MLDVRRRHFIKLLGGAAAAWPLVARAQQGVKLPLIGFLHQASPELAAAPRAAFEQGLKEAGFIEGQNLRIEYRWAENHYDQLPDLAADLVRRQVAVIVANTPTMQTAKAATNTIPIVFVSADDPVRLGFVASFNRPGGNATGVYFLIAALEAKRAELLHEIVPKTTTVALLLDPNFPSAAAQSREMQGALRSFGLDLLVLNAGNAAEIDAAFTALVREGAGALAVAATGLYFYRREQLVALAARHRVPTVYPWREAVVAGGLMSYGSSVADAYRQAGIYSGHILKGANPADLPVQQSVKVELAINLKTAQALGLTFPITLLARADEVIE
ncbi:MAG TPA: ABC transporter substrate-binding protein [Xanthobacteraceae bacterium]|jgi:putative ABC transport system substrate-binding protein|nr:ABC transporter substrate-binding protein [Xanthobacteraceae bacterium]